mmetsp:Transcript_13168/g.20479  ORF Transcript_13168/g.20479 Transcript_13168/m.20479 type:complete len:152 (-) Transcript_13168:920-1375(-)
MPTPRMSSTNGFQNNPILVSRFSGNNNSVNTLLSSGYVANPYKNAFSATGEGFKKSSASQRQKFNKTFAQKIHSDSLVILEQAATKNSILETHHKKSRLRFGLLQSTQMARNTSKTQMSGQSFKNSLMNVGKENLKNEKQVLPKEEPMKME